MAKASQLWSAQDVELTEKLWKDGVSATEIGKRIGRSRGAVLGFIHRQKFVRTEEVKKKLTRISPTVVLNARKPKKPQLFDTTAPRGEHLPLPTLPINVTPVPQAPTGRVYKDAKPWIERVAYECQFPVSGHGADTFYCCAPIPGLTGYCNHHRAIMYDRSAPRRKPDIRPSMRPR